MELQQFITTALKAIEKGIDEGEEGNIVANFPSGSSTNPGVEFDLAIQFADKEIHVIGEQTRDYPVLSRIKFTVPIYKKS